MVSGLLAIMIFGVKTLVSPLTQSRNPTPLQLLPSCLPKKIGT
jgi:hypothetical protein